ncbi:hypothetical protein RCJ22_00150, partial [Vibrio sp. FNV 38]|nr:hypothetical protein [Vibrio sp. FNV 38]
LGADDGIGVAVALAVLDDDTQAYPPLEAVFTTGEETGLIGAARMDMSGLRSKYCINNDSYRVDMIQACCAGSCFCVFRKKNAFETGGLDASAVFTVSGGRGGHSGLDIFLQRANTTILLGRLLNLL